MARRLRFTKIETRIPSSTVPNSQTEMVLNAEEVNSIDITSDARVQDKQSPTRKNVKSATTVVRRSKRLHSSPNQVRDIEPAVEEINVAESDQMEEELPIDEENHPHERTQDVTEVQPSQDERTGMAKLNYRSMYIDSQKKVKALMRKNRRLSKKLENALGKIEVYAELTPILSSLSKANETLSKRPWTVMRRWRT